MVVLTIDASSNGEAVYFDQPIEKPRFISLLSCSLQNSWRNLEEIGSISIKQNNVSNNVADFFPGNYNFDEITTYLTNKFKDQQKLTVKRDDLKRGFSITKTKNIESFSFDKNLSKLFKNTIVDAANARIEDFTIPDFYYIHCNLLSKENNLYNGKPSDILACVPITGKPYDLVHYPQNFINNSRRIDAVQSVNSVTLTVKDKTGMVCLGAVTAALSSGAVATSLTGVGIVIGAPVAAVAAVSGAASTGLITKVGSGSDHTTVYFRLGVPSVYFEFTYDKKKWSVSNYPVYHSLHDTFHWMKTFVDRDFEYHRTLTQLWLQIGLTLADQPLLPFNCSQYADRLTYYAKDIKTKYEEALTQQKISLDYFMSAVKNFSDAASTFNGWLNSVDQKNPLALRMANDRLMQIERAFINPQGLPGRPYMRHVVFAPSAHNAYAGSSFPGLVDALYSVQLLNVKDWELVKKELSVAAFYIQSATNVMLFESL
ncbi:hypothetical protein ACROYT_G040354 [Oculina patagonica]